MLLRQKKIILMMTNEWRNKKMHVPKPRFPWRLIFFEPPLYSLLFMDFRIALAVPAISVFATFSLAAAEDSQPFGADFPHLDNAATGQWWTLGRKEAKDDNQKQPPKNLIKG